MSTGDWTAGEIAVYDQYMADATDEVSRLAETLRCLMARRGETQGVADVTALLLQRPHGDVTAVLVAALKRIASEDAP